MVLTVFVIFENQEKAVFICAESKIYIISIVHIIRGNAIKKQGKTSAMQPGF
jgi:hypothetical protein